MLLSNQDFVYIQYLNSLNHKVLIISDSVVQRIFIYSSFVPASTQNSSHQLIGQDITDIFEGLKNGVKLGEGNITGNSLDAKLQSIPIQTINFSPNFNFMNFISIRQ